MNQTVTQLFNNIDNGMLSYIINDTTTVQAEIKGTITKIMILTDRDSFDDIASFRTSMDLIDIIQKMTEAKFDILAFKSLYELIKECMKNKVMLNLNNWIFITEEQKLFLGIS